MNEDTAAVVAELRALTEAVQGLRRDVKQAAACVASASLIAVDASRSEVFAVYMDDELMKVADRMLKAMNKASGDQS